MFKCSQGECPNGRGAVCCCSCEDYAGCEGRCEEVPAECGHYVEVTESKTTDIVPFQTKAMVIMQKIADLNTQKKQLEAQDKEVRQQLEKVMGEYGITKFENDILKVTYVAPSTRESIDSAKLKKELPAVAAKYTKISQVKGSVRIEVK